MDVVITSCSRACVRHLRIQTGALCNTMDYQRVERDL
jgi:hypothetical protein